MRLPIKVFNFFNFIPLYVILFPWYTILFLYGKNDIKLSPYVVIIPLLIASVSSLVLLGIFRLIFRNAIKAGILTGVLTLIVFMYGPLRGISSFAEFSIGPVPISWDYLYMFFSLLLIIFSLVYLLRTKRGFFRTNRIFNAIGILLLVVVVIPIAVNLFRIHFSLEELGNQDEITDTSSDNTVTGGIGTKPDIYYIIPDDYGAPDTMKGDYNLDTSQFINFLKSRGFYIADQSKTNYPFSTFMVAAALNMNYLNSKNFPAIKTQAGGAVINNALQNSKALKFIKSQGYSYFHIGGWYDPLRYNNFADINFVYNNKLNLDEFSNTLLQNTIFYPLILRYFGVSGRANQIGNTEYQFQALENMPSQVSPKFVFVDILSPHTPNIFDPACNINHTRVNSMTGFTNQVSCADMKLEGVIDSILKNSKTPPVIILQTDEGAKDSREQAIKYPNKTGVKGGFKDASTNTILERVKILSAFYLPGLKKNPIYPSISPVNTLRVIFNAYFGTKYSILPDKVYTFDDYDKLYKFIFNDVTEQISGK